MVVAAGTVAPFFVGFVLVVPVFLVAAIVAGADKFLPIAFAAEMVVHFAMFVEVQVRLGLVDDYLMTVIEIEVPVTGGQVAGEDPAAFALMDELMIGYIVVRLDVGDIIIIDMIIAGGPPGWLDADVDGEMDLGLRRVAKGRGGE